MIALFLTAGQWGGFLAALTQNIGVKKLHVDTYQKSGGRINETGYRLIVLSNLMLHQINC